MSAVAGLLSDREKQVMRQNDSLATLAASAVLVGGGAVAALPAQAADADDCSLAEYRNIDRGDTLSQVRRMMDDDGQLILRTRAYRDVRFGTYDPGTTTYCQVSFYRQSGTTGAFRVQSKYRIESA